ncbi:SufE family protein [Alteromonas lipolytica]|uniref:Fe-S metabolism associated domain-containing protein n=1 Tax=Alteromonas lipolytica TaxID=1856405 RepID=A0A1E8FJ31_9ALTE|nr:SufE family protein [Alteromonas lipolytica]OFI35756.1 hypothetical protein BFC17_10745 [Alteromonas lipolytica]GGF80500.1 Fe-S metabolism protein SufE [Alteromonas lipolytica]
MTTSNTPLADQLTNTRGWDNLLRQLMLAGKALEPLPAEQRSEETEVKGCQSRVWLRVSVVDNQLVMQAWSDSKILRGVLAVIQEKVRQLTKPALSEFDFSSWFEAVQLQRYLSQSRANGINEVIKQLRVQSEQPG